MRGGGDTRGTLTLRATASPGRRADPGSQTADAGHATDPRNRADGSDLGLTVHSQDRLHCVGSLGRCPPLRHTQQPYTRECGD